MLCRWGGQLCSVVGGTPVLCLCPPHLFLAAQGCTVPHPDLWATHSGPQRQNCRTQKLLMFYLLAIPKHIHILKVSEKACRQGRLPFTDFHHDLSLEQLGKWPPASQRPSSPRGTVLNPHP